MANTALIILAEGAEEMETIIIADVLRRAEIKVTIAGINGTGTVKCSRDVMIVPDAALADVAKEKFSLVVVPGGNPTSVKQLAESMRVGEILRSQDHAGRLIGAICAGPKCFLPHKIAQDKLVTSYPLFQKDMEAAGYKYSTDRVNKDGHVITSRGPGTAMEFALACASAVTGENMEEKLGPAMLFQK